jgi:hypothetical protein
MVSIRRTYARLFPERWACPGVKRLPLSIALLPPKTGCSARRDFGTLRKRINVADREGT